MTEEKATYTAATQTAEPEKKHFPTHQCPYCNNKLHFVRLRKHVNERTGYRYARMVHHCPTCDYWLRDDSPWIQAERILGENIVSLEDPAQSVQAQ